MSRKSGLPNLEIPLLFKIWMAFCLLLGLGMLGVIVWAIIAIVTKVTR